MREGRDDLPAFVHFGSASEFDWFSTAIRRFVVKPRCQTETASTKPAMPLSHVKRLSCGVVILNADRELLLCHVTGQNHWDLPKGGIDSGESPQEAALRETREETGLRLPADSLIDLGRFEYTAKKNLYLFATLMPRFDIAGLRCESHYFDRLSGREQPEMDGYGWFAFERASTLCTQKMAAVLTARIDLAQVLATLIDGGVPQPRVVLATAA
jgi:putative (di)nucleoside polyphosphate hydrolase